MSRGESSSPLPGQLPRCQAVWIEVLQSLGAGAHALAGGGIGEQGSGEGILLTLVSSAFVLNVILLC